MNYTSLRILESTRCSTNNPPTHNTHTPLPPQTHTHAHTRTHILESNHLEISVNILVFLKIEQTRLPEYYIMLQGCCPNSQLHFHGYVASRWFMVAFLRLFKNRSYQLILCIMGQKSKFVKLGSFLGHNNFENTIGTPPHIV